MQNSRCPKRSCLPRDAPSGSLVTAPLRGQRFHSPVIFGVAFSNISLSGYFGSPATLSSPLHCQTSLGFAYTTLNPKMSSHSEANSLSSVGSCSSWDFCTLARAAASRSKVASWRRIARRASAMARDPPSHRSFGSGRELLSPSSSQVRMTLNPVACYWIRNVRFEVTWQHRG